MNKKVAIVTGGTSGIGEAIARALANLEMLVILVGRNGDRGKEIAADINGIGQSAEFYSCDVSREADIIELHKKISANFPAIDVLINNAGIYPIEGEISDTSHLIDKKIFDTNFFGTYGMVKYFISDIVKQKGIIINNASTAGIQSFTAGRSYLYASSKDAVVKFTKMLAKNYATQIRVNCICPGITDTPLYINKDFSRFYSQIPMERVATPEDIANLVEFLVSERSGYITGAVIPIDGGQTL